MSSFSPTGARAAELAAHYIGQRLPAEWAFGEVAEHLAALERQEQASRALELAPAVVDLAQPRCSPRDRPADALPSVLQSLTEAWDFLPKDAKLRRLVKDRRLALMLSVRPANRNSDSHNMRRVTAKRGGRRRTREHCPWTGAHLDEGPALKTRETYKAPGDHCDRTGVRFIWQCDANPDHRYWTQQPCDRSDCQTCAPNLDARKQARAVQSLGAVDFGAAVLTLPRSWGWHASPVRLRYVRQLAIEVYRAALAPAVWRRSADSYRGRKDQLRAGGVAAVHPIGKSCDHCGAAGDDVGVALAMTGTCPRCGRTPTPHPHVDMTGSEVWMLSTGEMVEAPLYLEAQELDRMQNLWWFCLAAMGALASLDPGPIGQVHYLYRRGPKHRAHRLGYCVRGFPAWDMRGAGISRRWGLASPGAVSKRIRSFCRRAAAQLWQELHCVPAPETGDIKCPECGDKPDGGRLYLSEVRTNGETMPGSKSLTEARGPP